MFFKKGPSPASYVYFRSLLRNKTIRSTNNVTNDLFGRYLTKVNFYIFPMKTLDESLNCGNATEAIKIKINYLKRKREKATKT